VDADRFHPREPSARPAEPRRGFVVGTVGKMSRGRGHEEAIAAGARVVAVRLAHVGHGEHQPELRRLAATLGAAERNDFLGYQEDTLPDLYRSWDAFLFPASGADQGQRAILEAMASGLPVVALDVPGVRDLLTDGVDGVVVGRADDLAPALARLAGDPDLRRRLGIAARDRALAFTPERFAARAREFYEAVLRGSPALPADASWATPSDKPAGSARRAR
jgi:glycosyltransferase involved in cell wall biosynthesis